MFGYDRLLAMNTGVEGGETALKLARLIEIFFHFKAALEAFRMNYIVFDSFSLPTMDS